MNELMKCDTFYKTTVLPLEMAKVIFKNITNRRKFYIYLQNFIEGSYRLALRSKVTVEANLAAQVSASEAERKREGNRQELGNISYLQNSKALATC